MILLGSLTGCQALDQPLVFSQEEQKKPEAPSIASAPAVATVAVKQKYLYALADNVVYIRPINSDTGDIESPVVGGWLVRPPLSQDFNHFTISPDGKYLYGLDAFNSKIYQYAIGEIGAWTGEYQYSTGLLTALTPAYKAISISRSALAFGNDNRLYSQYAGQADQFTVNNGNLVYVQLYSVAGFNAAKLIYQPNFSNITSVSNGDHTYIVNTNTGRVEHWMGGALRDSTEIAAQNGIPKIPIHMIIN